jgi:hypothetical protein
MALSDHLVMTLLVGAARADASPAQVEQMRARIVPVMRDQSVPYVEVRAVLQQIMGPDWAPSGDWAAQIDALGGVR